MENKKYIIIQLKDICYYNDDFEYEPYIVEYDKNFEEKYNRLVNICKSYNNFDEIEDFIYNNFKVIESEKRIIEI